MSHPFSHRSPATVAAAALVACLAVLLWADPAGAASVYRYDITVEGYMRESFNDPFSEDPRTRGSQNLVVSWRGTFRGVRLNTVFFNRRSVSIHSKPAGFQQGQIRARVQFKETRTLHGGPCDGGLTTPAYRARLVTSALALKGVRSRFSLLAQLRPGAAEDFYDLWVGRQRSACRDSLLGLPHTMRDKRARKHLSVVSDPLAIHSSFEREAPRGLPFPIYPLSRGQTVTYTTGLQRKSIPGFQPGSTLSTEHRLSFVFKRR